MSTISSQRFHETRAHDRLDFDVSHATMLKRKRFFFRPTRAVFFVAARTAARRVSSLQSVSVVLIAVVAARWFVPTLGARRALGCKQLENEGRHPHDDEDIREIEIRP